MCARALRITTKLATLYVFCADSVFFIIINKIWIRKKRRRKSIWNLQNKCTREQQKHTQKCWELANVCQQILHLCYYFNSLQAMISLCGSIGGRRVAVNKQRLGSRLCKNAVFLYECIICSREREREREVLLRTKCSQLATRREQALQQLKKVE